jgi:hypothetical protein
VTKQNYTGLPPALKEAVFSRDNWRCRWCGATNAWPGYDVHHIQYRRGYAYDVIENLITLDRRCHDLMHDSYAIPKATAQEILTRLISDEGSGLTGMAIERAMHGDSETETDVHLDRDDGPVGRLIGKEELRALGSSES